VLAARDLGVELAKKALEKNIKKAVFDRGSYRYHGRVKSLADGAREGGLRF
jgi:large subunit ribosomal protein L18